MVEDITQVRRATDRLRLQGQLLDAVGEAIIATDLSGRVTYWNPAAERLFGWSADEALGQSILDLNVNQADRETAADIMAAVTNGETWSGEFPVRRKDGTTFIARVTDAPYVDPEGSLAGVIACRPT